MILWKNTSS